MLGSDTLPTQPVGFGPDRIRNRLEKPLPVDLGIGDVTSSRQKRRPGILITILDCVRIQEKMRQIIMDVDSQCLAALHKGVEEGGDRRTGLCDVEQPVLPAHSERPDGILGSLVAACGEWIVKEPDKSVPPVKRILEGDLQLPDGPVHIPEAETMDPLENRLKLLPSCLEIPFGRHEAVPE